MKRWLKIGLGASFSPHWRFSPSVRSPPSLCRNGGEGVSLDSVGQNPVVILADKEGKKALPIWIGLLEANAIDKELKNISSRGR